LRADRGAWDGIAALQPAPQIYIGATPGAEGLERLCGRLVADRAVSHGRPPSAAPRLKPAANPPRWNRSPKFPSPAPRRGPGWHSRRPCPPLRGSRHKS